VRFPEGMGAEAWARIAKLPDERRDRVLERACLIYYGGAAKTLAEADEMALAAEGIHVQQRMVGT